MLGTRALQIFDETTCVVRAVLRWTEFYKHESCGKCTPVPRGHLVAGADAGQRLEQGRGSRERPRDARRHLRQHPRPFVLRAGRRRDVSPITSSIKYFREEYLAHLDPRRLPVRPDGVHRVRRRGGDRMTTTPEQSKSRAPEKSDEVTLTIDGIEVSVPKNTLVIRAAEQVGVQIPRFCDHPLLAPGRRLPPVPGRGPRRRQRPRRCPSRRPPARSPSPRAWWSTPRPPRRSPTRRSRDRWSSC